MLGTK